jgi:hypothetical protein
MDNIGLISIVKKRISELQEYGLRMIFTIATTSKIEKNPYLTPIRKSNDFVVSGCVVFDKNNLIELLKLLDGVVDIILVDQEKKIPISILDDKKIDNDTCTQGLVGSVDTGNFYSISSRVILKSKVYGFKPNDLTVDAAWSFLNYKDTFLSGHKVSIMGAGNIGSKLALKIVECGSNVVIYGRSEYKNSMISNGLNTIKAKNTISNINYSSDILKASFMSDIMICSANGANIITSDVVSTLKNECIIIEIGKNNLTQEAIDLALSRKIEIYRLDISASLIGYIYFLLKTIDILDNSYGKNKINDLTFVSGGYFGSKGDVVTDNCFNPKQIYGESDGKGSLAPIVNKKKQNKTKLIIERKDDGS